MASLPASVMDLLPGYFDDTPFDTPISIPIPEPVPIDPDPPSCPVRPMTSASNDDDNVERSESIIPCVDQSDPTAEDADITATTEADPSDQAESEPCDVLPMFDEIVIDCGQAGQQETPLSEPTETTFMTSTTATPVDEALTPAAASPLQTFAILTSTLSVVYREFDILNEQQKQQILEAAVDELAPAELQRRCDEIRLVFNTRRQELYSSLYPLLVASSDQSVQ